MKRLVCTLLALLVLAFAASASALEFTTPILGEQFYPEGTNAETASFIFRYGLPKLVEGDDISDAINAYYAALSGDMSALMIQQTIETLDALPLPEEPAYYSNVGYRVTGGGDDYLSILLTNQTFLGNAETESWTANVFALNGLYAGQLVSLSQVLGMEQSNDSGNVSDASKLVYSLVWEIIQQQKAARQADYFEELTPEGLTRVFTPETDFYIDGDGNLVFYIQQGAIATEVSGILIYPFSVSELLSAVQ